MTQDQATGLNYQVHDRFKVFSGPLGADGGIGSLAEQVADFVAQQQVAAKSIGVEFLESSNQLLVTLGYRSDEAYYPVTVQTAPVGQFAANSGDFTALEAALGKASAQHNNVICHAEYITQSNDFVIVFLTHQA